jgi:hypothetical protein
MPLRKGEFTVYVFLLDRKALHVYDRRILDHAFSIEADEFVVGLIETPHEWLRTPELAATPQEAAESGTDRRPAPPSGLENPESDDR